MSETRFETLFKWLPSFGFDHKISFAYVLSIKLVFFTTVIIWFLVEKKWWRYALLSPILITIYQLQSLFTTEADVIDEYEIIQALPLLGLVLIILLALSKNAKDVYLFKAIYQKNYTKLEKLVKKRHHQKLQDLEKAKQELADYKSNTSKGKLEDLLALKKRLEAQRNKNA